VRRKEERMVLLYLYVPRCLSYFHHPESYDRGRSSPHVPYRRLFSGKLYLMELCRWSRSSELSLSWWMTGPTNSSACANGYVRFRDGILLICCAAQGLFVVVTTILAYLFSSSA